MSRKMKGNLAALLAIGLLLLSGCSEHKRSDGPVAGAQPESKPGSVATYYQKATEGQSSQPRGGGGGGDRNHSSPSTGEAESLNVSLDQATSVQAATSAADRKIIRNADLTVETESPTDVQRRITTIAERLGGFVVTSEFKQTTAQAKTSESVVVVARVPASQFSSALDQIHGLGGKLIQEKVSGQDVSEEYVDLEARLRTKRALEAQFLDIMKQAKKVSDALEVQTQLADVRTEIERLEGRRRFLENQSALSTITATLQLPAPVVATTSTGFGQDVKQSLGDAVDMAAAIILFLVRAVIVLAPLVLIFGLPAWFVWRFARRRLQVTEKPASILES